jgi:ribosomal protein S18 acetylase RimI-like enzyme
LVTALGEPSSYLSARVVVMTDEGRGYEIRRVRAEDWQRLRDLRIEMLRDTPKAFLETVEHALRRSDRDWRARAERDAADRRSARFVAETPQGELIGAMGCYTDRPGRATLFAVYVTPAWRSKGVAEALLVPTAAWARDVLGGRDLYLLVHEENARARAFYRRLGFVETGGTTPYELDPRELEIEMVRPLT